MNTRYSLSAVVREETGHAVRSIRKMGNIPATIYGRGSTPITLSVEAASFLSVYKKAKETHIIDLSIKGKIHPVLIHKVQKHPVDQHVSNVEFLIVNLTEKLQMSVPIITSGVSPAVEEGRGIIITVLQEVQIETLPTNIPESIVVDVSGLVEINQEIKTKELKMPSSVVMLSDPEMIVVKIGSKVVEKPVEPKEVVPTTQEDAAEKTPTPEDQPKE